MNMLLLVCVQTKNDGMFFVCLINALFKKSNLEISLFLLLITELRQ